MKLRLFRMLNCNGATKVHCSPSFSDASSVEILENLSEQAPTRLVRARRFFTSLPFFWTLILLGPVWYCVGAYTCWHVNAAGYPKLIPAAPGSFFYSIAKTALNVSIIGMFGAFWLTLLGLIGAWARSSTLLSRIFAGLATGLYFTMVVVLFDFLFR